MHGLLQVWRDGFRTLCPLCYGPAQRNRLCRGCEQETYGARQRRAVCVSCAQDLASQTTRMPSRFSLSVEDFRATASSSVRKSPPCCRVCARQCLSHDWCVCALDGGFPASLLLRRFFGGASDLSLGPVFATLMWQKVEQAIALNADVVQHPDVWVAWPADQACVDRCLCNPAQEMAKALSRISARPCVWQGIYVRQSLGVGVSSWGVRETLAGLRVALVSGAMPPLDCLADVARACKAAGVQQLGLVATTLNPAL